MNLNMTGKHWVFVAVVGATLASAPCFAQSLEILAPDCRVPEAPNIPDGATATEDQLVAAQKKVKAYQADAAEYRTCLEKAKKSLGSTILPEQAHVLTAAYNQTVDTEQATGDMFNAAVRQFKAHGK